VLHLRYYLFLHPLLTGLGTIFVIEVKQQKRKGWLSAAIFQPKEEKGLA
jgi:hypothetical protein